MKANTAVCFIATGGICLLPATRWQPGRPGVPEKIATICSVLVITIAALTLGEYAGNWNLGLDEAMFRDLETLRNPGRMSAPTAVGFILVNTALMLRRGAPGAGRLAGIGALGLTAMFLGLFAVLGWLGNLAIGFGWGESMALHSGVAFVLLGIACTGYAWRGARLHLAIPERLMAMFVLGLSILAVISLVSYKVTQQFAATTSSLQYRQETLGELRAVFSDVVNMQIAMQSYMITGREDYLEAYGRSVARLEIDRAALRKLARSDGDLVSPIETLEGLIRRRLEFNNQVLGAHEQSGVRAAAALISSGEGMAILEQIRMRVAEMERAQEMPLAQQERAAKAFTARMFFILPAGTIVGLAALLAVIFFLNREIGERRKAEEKLRESEVQFRTMVDAMAQLAWMAHPDGTVFWFNQQWFEFTGMTPENVGEDRTWLHDPKVLPEVQAAWRHSLTTGQKFEMTFPLRGRDGEFRWFLTRAFALKDEAGRVLRWCGTNTDISDIRAAEQEIQRLNSELEQRVIERTAQLEEANRELEAFSYSVSHDLRTPLRAVDGFSQAVLEDYGGQLPSEGRRYLATIRQGAKQMGQLIDDLLTFSRLSRAPLRKVEIDMEQMVREVIDELADERAGRSVAVSVGVLPKGAGDPLLLKQVWVNLLSNAFKYTRKRGRALVEVGANGEEFFVRDNGTGFDMKYAAKLFGVFQRLHRAEDYEGTGVGLALVQRIVKRHGGRVRADAALDRGATFYFTLQAENKP